MNLIDALEYPNFEYSNDGFGEYLKKADATNGQLGAGQYSRFWDLDGDFIPTRDTSTCNKLFYGYNTAGDFATAN